MLLQSPSTPQKGVVPPWSFVTVKYPVSITPREAILAIIRRNWGNHIPSEGEGKKSDSSLRSCSTKHSFCRQGKAIGAALDKEIELETNGKGDVKPCEMEICDIVNKINALIPIFDLFKQFIVISIEPIVCVWNHQHGFCFFVEVVDFCSTSPCKRIVQVWYSIWRLHAVRKKKIQGGMRNQDEKKMAGISMFAL